MEDVKTLLEKYQIKPQALMDQFFLTDDTVIDEAISAAEVNKNDVVLEVGAGIGNLTRRLAEKAGKVISFEIDERFKDVLHDLPENVEMHFEDAWEYIQLHGKWRKKKEYNKVVANLPYSFVEKFLHNLTFLEYDQVILLVPSKFAKKIENNAIFGSFFRVELLRVVKKHLFFPVPRTDSMLVNLIKLPDPLLQKNLPMFLRQYMYQHEAQKVRNSLTEGLITYSWLTENKTITKNDARKIIDEKILEKELLTTTPGSKIYEVVSRNFSAD